MATEGTPFRDRYASEARAAAARAHAPPVEEPPTPVPRRVNSPEPRKAAPTPTPPSKLLQRYLASEATKIPEAPGALEAEVRARTRALELEVARADSAHTTYHGRRRVRNDDGLDGAARGVDAAAPGACISDRAGRSPGPCRRAPALLVLAATSCCCSSRCATELLLVVSATSRRRTRGSEAVCGSPGTRAMMLQVTGAARRRLRESWRVLDRCLVHQRSRKAYAAKPNFFAG